MIDEFTNRVDQPVDDAVGTRAHERERAQKLAQAHERAYAHERTYARASADKRVLELMNMGNGVVKAEEIMLQEGWDKGVTRQAIDAIFTQHASQDAANDMLIPFLCVCIVVTLLATLVVDSVSGTGWDRLFIPLLVVFLRLGRRIYKRKTFR